jgi:hypothetical protein
VGQEVAVTRNRRGTAHRLGGDRARRANDVVAVQRQREVLLGEFLDGEVHGGGLLLDHPVIQRALAGLALVVLQHVGLEGELQLGDVAGRAHFDGKAIGVALAEEDAALKTGVGAHAWVPCVGGVWVRVRVQKRGRLAPGWRCRCAISQSAGGASISIRSPTPYVLPAWVCGRVKTMWVMGSSKG